MKLKDFSKMPMEIEDLIRRGVYSLFALRSADPYLVTPEPYLLVTDRGLRYFVASDGSIARKADESVKGTPVTFEDVEPSLQDMLKSL